MMRNSGRLGIHKVDALKRSSIKSGNAFSKNDAKGLEILAKELEKVEGAKENAQVNIDLALYLDLLKKSSKSENTR